MYLDTVINTGEGWGYLDKITPTQGRVGGI